VKTTQKIGILVLREFPGNEDQAFLTIASNQEFLAQVNVNWLNTDPPRKPTPFYAAKHTWLRPQNYKPTLYSIPQSVKRDFNLSDLEFPAPMVGAVLIVNLHAGYSMKTFAQTWDASIPFEDMLKSPRTGGIAWLRLQNLPFVLAVTQPKNPAIPLDDIRHLLALEPDRAVICCAYEFDREYIDKVLSALVKLVEG